MLHRCSEEPPCSLAGEQCTSAQGKDSSAACCAAQVSYMILQRVSPVTHSIGNCLKRVIVIIASVVIFQNPMSQKNILGVPRLSCTASRSNAQKGCCPSSSRVHRLTTTLWWLQARP